MMIYVRFMRALALMAAIICTAETVAAYGLGNDYRIPATLSAVEIGSYWFFTRWQRRLEREALLAMPEVQAFRDAMHIIETRIGDAFTPTMQVVADVFVGMMHAIREPFVHAQFPSGTVQNPSDPSPRPRP